MSGAGDMENNFWNSLWWINSSFKYLSNLNFFHWGNVVNKPFLKKKHVERATVIQSIFNLHNFLEDLGTKFVKDIESK